MYLNKNLNTKQEDLCSDCEHTEKLLPSTEEWWCPAIQNWTNFFHHSWKFEQFSTKESHIHTSIIQIMQPEKNLLHRFP